LFSDDVFFPVVESTVLTDRGKYAEAESLLIDAIDMDKNNPAIYIYLSEVYRQSKNDEKYESVLIEGNGKFNDNDLRQALIIFYKRNGMYDKGIGFVKSLLEKEPDSSPYLGELGYFYSLKKDIPKAEEAFLKSIEINPKNSQSLNNLAWLYCENNMKIGDAISYSKKACELEPYSDTYLDTLAEAYYLNKSYDLAVDTIQKAIKINPNYTYLQQQLDKIEKAKKMIGEK
jgi:tetratricopeptide (TPR) repeat protein